MILSRRVAIDGAQLDQVHTSILIQAVDEGGGKETISAQSTAAANGQRVTHKSRDTLDVSVKFSINIGTAALDQRAAVLEAVSAWAAKAANGAWLTVNYKPGRRIRVILAQFPGLGDVRARTTPFAVLFRAYGVPFWQDTAPTVKTVSQATSGSCSLTVPGSAETVAAVKLTNKSTSVVNTASVYTGTDTFYFANLGLAANESLEIDHTDEGLLTIRIRSTGGTLRSAMDKRTEASSDDLRLQPGTVTAGFSAQRSCAFEISCRGRYL